MPFDFFNTQIHSLEELRSSLKEDSIDPRNLITILEDHHDYLEESILILMNPKSEVSDKRFHLSRFLTLVNMHGHAEEETLYLSLKSNSDKLARVEGLGGKDEHDIAYQIGDELKDLHFESTWSDAIEAKAVRVAGLVKNHIKEEESQMFKVAKNNLSTEQLEILAAQYIEKCIAALDGEIRLVKARSKSFNPVHPSSY